MFREPPADHEQRAVEAARIHERRVFSRYRHILDLEST